MEIGSVFTFAIISLVCGYFYHFIVFIDSNFGEYMLKYYTPENTQLAHFFLPQPLYAVLPFICAANPGKMWE